MDLFIQELKEKINSTDEAIFIAISGHGAAGKTSFAKKLCEELNTSYNYLNTDSYIVEGKYLHNTFASYEVDNQKAQYKITACMPIRHELSSLARDLQILRSGGDLLTIDKPWDPQRVLKGTKKVTIVEGMSVAFLEPFDFDLSIYIYTDSNTELKRREVRDINERGRELEMLIGAHKHRRYQYDLFMHPLKDKFQNIIDYSDDIFKIVK
ncbi:phosphoribulokinase [Phocicoccus pinnipedialis]|uniref:Uridine kinase n=1 Tax=Phocicoccus pinnipedialis TaxID=110845 RepID=A0A6V7RDA5_9BACL|nr:phosphoribulokinase [Jeotgalicoccus pinnipedialis]MBP1939458.1 uridine kinase [Jeotgalicoccus pinnipedialis]CAD2075333.1 Uridine kinase [Jeotgalicoccus pinnipedialis]